MSLGPSSVLLNALRLRRSRKPSLVSDKLDDIYVPLQLLAGH